MFVLSLKCFYLQVFVQLSFVVVVVVVVVVVIVCFKYYYSYSYYYCYYCYYYYYCLCVCVCGYQFWMPWPLKNRGILCQSAFYDCLDDEAGTVIVYVGSLQPGQADPYITDPLAHRKESAAAEQALKLVPTSETECPRMAFESFTTFTPLTDNLTRWNFYFEKTDYQVELPSMFLGNPSHKFFVE
jgi:hypothetical protein